MTKICILIVLILILGENLVENYCYWKNFDFDNPTNASCIPKDFIKVYDYYGRRNVTVSGKPCCEWLSCRQEGDSEDSFINHNYCRNIFQVGKTEADDEGPWCYRKDNKYKELCFPDCPASDYICVSTTKPVTVRTTPADNTDDPELPVIDIPTDVKKKRKSKEGLYVEPLTTFGFWTIIVTIIILLLMCAFFPLLRMYAARRALSKEGKTDEKHQADVESYRILTKIFRENGRTPPPFETFIRLRNKCGKVCDPKNVMQDD